MGQSSTCGNCDFEFWSGHSRHPGASFTLYLKCLAELLLPTASPWEPSAGPVS
jgi:hypothetical protein